MLKACQKGKNAAIGIFEKNAYFKMIIYIS